MTVDDVLIIIEWNLPDIHSSISYIVTDKNQLDGYS